MAYYNNPYYGYYPQMQPMMVQQPRSSYGREGNGYSHTSNREEVMDYLRDAMDMAEDEKDRKAINRLMTQMSER